VIPLLDESDLVWVETVIDVVERNAGLPWRMALEQLDDLQRALQLRPPPTHAWQRHGFDAERAHPTVARRFHAVIGAVQRITASGTRNVRVARKARGLVLGHPALDAATRAARLDHAATMLGIAVSDLEALLWCDLPRERPVELRSGRPEELEVAAFANVGLLQRAMRKAQAIEITVDDCTVDDPGLLVRAAAERGLIVHAVVEDGPLPWAPPRLPSRSPTPASPPALPALSSLPSAPSQSSASSPPSAPSSSSPSPSSRYSMRVRLEMLGPLALVNGTSVYGRALGDLVPLLADLTRWSLAIHVELPLARYIANIASPVLLPRAPLRRASEPFQARRLRKQLAKFAPRMTAMTTPPMMRAGDELLFPDLVLTHGSQATFVEVHSFWTRASLERRLAAYRALGAHVLLCIDVDRCADTSSAPESPNVLPYRKLVDVEALLRGVSLIQLSARPSR